LEKKESLGWYALQSFVKEKGLVRQHLDSYESFLNTLMQQVVDYYRDGVDVPGKNLKICFGKISIDKDPHLIEADRTIITELDPVQARIRNMDYSLPLMLEIEVRDVSRRVQEEKRPSVDKSLLAMGPSGMPTVKACQSMGIPIIKERVYIGRLPIMLRSSLCSLSSKGREELINMGEDPDDPGGYFIVAGSERVIVSQEDLVSNKVLVDVAPSTMPAEYMAKVFSYYNGIRSPVSLLLSKDGKMLVESTAFPVRIPFAVLMKALGVEKDSQIVNLVSGSQEIQDSMLVPLQDASEITSKEAALDYIGGRLAVGQPKDIRVRRAEEQLDTRFLPHLGTSTEDRLRKAVHLALMAEKILQFSKGMRKADDKDHYANKRLRLAGDLLSQLFAVAFAAFVKDFQYQVSRSFSRMKKVPNLNSLVRADLVSQRFQHALATGNWVGNKTGVSQLLDRTNYLSTISHLRRVISPLSRSQSHFEARDLHGTQWGRMCPNESPEGPNCGLVKNLAISAITSVDRDPIPVLKALNDEGVEFLDYKDNSLLKNGIAGKTGAKVFINGILIGFHQDPVSLVNALREKKRRGQLPYDLSFSYVIGQEFSEVYAFTDGGRIIRPLFVVGKDGKLKLTEQEKEELRSGRMPWSELIRKGVIEYMSAEEEENSMIALTAEEAEANPGKYTHCELDSIALLGVVASLIPYSNHNQSPRNSYQTAMAKQAIGVSTINFQKRLDTRAHVLHYPQLPLVTTKTEGLVGFNKRPTGQNFVVALLSYEGYNIEDAVILNKASVERGLGRSSTFRLYETEERKYPGGQEDEIGVPNETVRGYHGASQYSKLDPSDGIVFPDSDIEGGEVIIGKTSPSRFLEEFRELTGGEVVKHDSSVLLKHGENGVVDRVYVSLNLDGRKLVRVVVRDYRIPELGDKFASRHGQKGVVGLLVPQEDMPYTQSGIVPDLIMNPHAIPSRMTVGHLMEMLGGKVASLKGVRADGTPFEGETLEELEAQLKSLGFLPTGEEVMYDGRTGKMLRAKVYMGLAYYQRLHHMVADKMHARARGLVQILTHQPTEGRAREGGLRFGEMERDVLVAHGASSLLLDRLLESSDKSDITICENDGAMAYFDYKKNRWICPICGEKVKPVTVTMPYAFKLLVQEMVSMGIDIKVEPGEPV